MAKNMTEYRQLIELRNALRGRVYGKKKLAELKNAYAQEKSEQIMDPERLPMITVYRDACERKHEKKVKQSVEKYDKGYNAASIIFFVLLIVAVIVLGGLAIYFSAKWSWNTGVGAMAGKELTLRGGATHVVSYEQAVGMHLAALSMVLWVPLGIILLFQGLIADLMDDHPILRYLWYVPAGVSVLASFVALGGYFKYFYKDCHGLKSFFTLSKIEYKLFEEFCGSIGVLLVFILAIYVTILIVYFLVYWLTKQVKRAKNDTGFQDYAYRARRYDVCKTPEYKEAAEKDRKASAAERKVYEEYYPKAVALKKKTLQRYERAIAEMEEEIDKCTATIRSSTVVHPDYKNEESLNIILYYIEHGRADTVKEALNEYVHDCQFQVINRRMERLERRVARLESAVVEAIEGQRDELRRVVRRLDSMENNFIAAVNDVQYSVDTQTRVIRREHEALRESNRAEMNRALQEMTSARLMIQNRPWW